MFRLPPGKPGGLERDALASRESSFEALELLDQSLDPRRDLAPLALPLTLLLAQRLGFGQQIAGVLTLELALGFLQPRAHLLALALESQLVVLEALNQRRGLLDSLGEQVEIGTHHRGFGHFSLKRPPYWSATAAAILSCDAWISDSESVRSGCWNWSAYARLFIP